MLSGITTLNRTLLDDLDQCSDPFPLIGRLRPMLTESGVWKTQEKLLPISSEKSYPLEKIDYEPYIEGGDREVYLFYSNGKCVGRIRLRSNWNGYCRIEDLAVARSHRRMGVGTHLIRQAQEWCDEHGLNGLMAETQDTNVLACRFYAKCGFALGGVDGMLYSASPTYAHEMALFWYRPNPVDKKEE